MELSAPAAGILSDWRFTVAIPAVDQHQNYRDLITTHYIAGEKP